MSMPEQGCHRLRMADLGQPALFIATAAGSGLLRPAPGTWGSLLAAGLAVLALSLAPTVALTPLLVAATVLATLAGLVTVPQAQRRCGNGDPGAVVIDEVAGVWLALALQPADLLARHPLLAPVVCFGLFRVFDILKPGPVAWAEALPGALGVMLDDLIAGLIAGACAFAFLH
jgi:phosphatidylglycerophosphatase A